MLGRISEARTNSDTGGSMGPRNECGDDSLGRNGLRDKDRSKDVRLDDPPEQVREAQHIVRSGNPVPLPLAPAQQIVLAIAEGRALAAPAPPDHRQPPSPVRSLRIALQPEGLGTVHVTLKLKGKHIEISLETQTGDGQRLLERDRGLLERMVEEAGFRVEDTAIRITTAPAALFADPSTAPDHSPSPSGRADTSAHHRQTAQRNNGEAKNGETAGKTGDTHDADRQPGRGGGAVYL